MEQEVSKLKNDGVVSSLKHDKLRSFFGGVDWQADLDSY